jgi:hypothetical protein
MAKGNNILNELKAISPTVANLPGQVLYTVPDGYFENFAATMLLLAKTQHQNANEETQTLSALLHGLKKHHTYQAPDNYFNDLPVSLVEGAKAIDFVNSELENLSPLMSNLRNKNVYSVPQNYFYTFAGEVLQKIHTKKQAKVIAMPLSRSIIRYVAAAIVTAVIATGSWLFFKKDVTSPTQKPVTEVAQLQNSFELLKDEDIINYVNESSVATVTPYVDAATLLGTEMKDTDIKNIIADISDDELQQYLEEYPLTKETLN